MLLAEHLGSFREPLVIFHNKIRREFFDQGLDFRRGGEVRELHEGGEARVEIGIRNDARAEEEVLCGLVAAERADGVSAEFGVFGDEGGLVCFGAQSATRLFHPK